MDQKAYTFGSTFADKIQELFAQGGFGFITSLAILWGGWYLAGWVHRYTKTHLQDNPKVDVTWALMLANMARYLLLVFAAIAVLNHLGVETTSIVAVIGAAGLAIGLALQGTLSNIAAGLMLIFLRPFRIGDFIETSDVEFSVVREINIFTTEVRTFDGKIIHVPNAQLWNKPISNFTEFGKRRIEFFLSIRYEDDVQKACDALISMLKEQSLVLKDPEPIVSLWKFQDSGLELLIRIWVKPKNYLKVRLALAKLSKDALEKVGVGFPYSQLVLHMAEQSQASIEPPQNLTDSN